MIDLQSNTLVIPETKFIFKTNFAGDPDKDTFGSDKRRGNIIIPDPEEAAELRALGYNVKATKPKPNEPEDEFVPDYYVSIQLNYDSQWPPEVYLVSGNAAPVLLDAKTVGKIDKCYVRNVRASLNLYINKKTGNKSIYVKVMYVEQDIASDPFAHIYADRNGENLLPF